MVDNSAQGPLAGRRIALLETREAERLAQMFRDQGATVLGHRAIAIVEAPDPTPVLAWLRRFVDNPPAYLVLLTGEGLAHLHRLAQGSGSDEAFVAALANTTTVTRGPKPARALRSLGLSSQLRAMEPTTDGVIASLSAIELRGRRVGVQLYPGANSRLCEYLEGVGAQPDPITPYAYAACESDEALAGLVDQVIAGEIDAIAFTSASQARRLFEVAETAHRVDALKAGLGASAVAAVGPVVAAELRRSGVVPTIVPAGQYFMKPLVTAIVEALAVSGAHANFRESK